MFKTSTLTGCTQLHMQDKPCLMQLALSLDIVQIFGALQYLILIGQLRQGLLFPGIVLNYSQILITNTNIL